MSTKSGNKPIFSFFVFWISFTAFVSVFFLKRSTVLSSMILVLLAGLILFLFRKKISIRYVSDIHDSEVYIYVFSLLVCFGFFVFLSVKTSFYSILWHIAELINVPVAILSKAFYLGVSVVSFPFVCASAKYVFKDIMELKPGILKTKKSWLRTWLILALVYCFAIITIIRSDYIYKDDMQRVVDGMTIYTRENRILAEYMLGLFETNAFFGDISPLTQLSEMCLMALSALILFRVISEKDKAGFWDYVGMITFGIFPYFMEPISFKYDSPQHGLAVFFAVLPLLYYKRDSIKYIIITSLCIVLSCSSHQVPMTVFPMAVIIISIINFNTGRQNCSQLKKFIFSSICGYCTGLVFYRVFIMEPIGYNLSLSTVNSVKSLIPGMVQNYSKFLTCIFEDYNPLWLIITSLIFICFIVAVIRNTVLRKSRSFFVTVSGIILMIALANSLYPLLEAPLFQPRHIYSFGLFTGMVAIASVSFCKQRAIIEKTCSLILAMCYISFSLIYGNMLSYQKEYTGMRVKMVIEDLNQYPAFRENPDVEVQIVGSTGLSPVVYYHAEHYPILNRLVTTSFDEYFGDWYATDLYNLYGLNAIYNPVDYPDLSSLELPKIRETYYYNIYSDNVRFVVELKERSKTAWL